MSYAAANDLPALEVAHLRAELDALRLANIALQEQSLVNAEQTDQMLCELEQQRDKLRQAHRQLQVSNSFISRVMDTAGDLVVVLDTEGRIRQANRCCSEALQRAPGELVDTAVDVFLPPEERAALQSALQPLPWQSSSVLFDTVRAAGTYVAEHRLANGSGRYVTYLLRANLLHTPQGKLEGAVISAADISTLKEQERAMRLAASVFNGSLNGIMITAPDGTIEQVNPAFTQLTGYTAEEAVGRTPRILRSDHQPGAFFNDLWRQLLDKGEWAGEIWNLRKNGESFVVWHSIVAMRDENGIVQHYVGTFYDITEQKQAALRLLAQKRELEEMVKRLNEAQNQLLQADKMASIGQLAAGVAHEINNPVGFINSNVGTLEHYLDSLFVILDAYERTDLHACQPSSGSAEMLALKERLDYAFLREDVAGLINETKDGIARVKKIVQDLKDFSHVDQTAWQWADLHKGLDSTLNVAWNEIKYKADVIKEYGQIPEVECLPGQLNQVFMNLLINATHAIAERGTIIIRSGVDGEGVWIEIEDSGCGIPEEHLNRIFDPFFTTKPVGKGTGLGLSLSYGIVEKHKGRLSVSSKVGVGTTFRLWIPIVAVAHTEVAPKS